MISNGEALWLLLWVFALGWMEQAERLRFGIVLPWRALTTAAFVLLLAAYTSEETA